MPRLYQCALQTMSAVLGTSATLLQACSLPVLMNITKNISDSYGKKPLNIMLHNNLLVFLSSSTSCVCTIYWEKVHHFSVYVLSNIILLHWRYGIQGVSGSIPCRCHPHKEGWGWEQENQGVLGQHPRGRGGWEVKWAVSTLQAHLHCDALAPDQQAGLWHYEPRRITHKTGDSSFCLPTHPSTHLSHCLPLALPWL